MHAYTRGIRPLLPALATQLAGQHNARDGRQRVITNKEMDEMLAQMKDAYGVLVAYSNIRKCHAATQPPGIRDPDLPGVDFSLVLASVWGEVRRLKSPSLDAHFRETLVTIGATCLQGVTHRLLCDYLALFPLDH